MDVLNRAERLLPQLELRGRLELLKPCLEVVVLRLGQCHIGAIALVAILLKVGQVIAQDLTEAAELGGALVSHTEVECAVGRHGVEPLQLVVVAQDLEDSSVGLPQELEPRGDELAIGAILVALSRDRLQHQVLRGVLSLEIFDVDGSGRSGSLSRLRLLGRKLQKVLDHLLERVDVHLLAHDPVLDQTILREAPLLELDAQFHVLEHDLLEDLLPGTVALRRDHIVERLKGGVGLTDVNQLLL